MTQDEYVYYNGFSQPPSSMDAKTLKRKRLGLVLDIEFLNSLPMLLAANPANETNKELVTRITSTKLVLMKTVWGPDWGDFEKFTLWAESGAFDSIPAQLKAAASYYLAGYKRDDS